MKEDKQTKHCASEQIVSEVVDRLLGREIERGSFIDFVSGKWLKCQFVMRCNRLSTLRKSIAEYTGRSKPTFHGRSNQPVSTSWRLFGGVDEISARLVFDPNTDNHVGLKGIEPHSHPVTSLILVTQGSGDFFLLHSAGQCSYFIRVPITPGYILCFPAGILHTMRPGAKGIETLNVTDRENLPLLRGTTTLVYPTESRAVYQGTSFSTPESIPIEAKRIDYRDYQRVAQELC